MAKRPAFQWWLDHAERFGLVLRGDQLEGPCPYCGGHDRFHVNRHPDGLFGCRRCRGYLEILKAAQWNLPPSLSATIPDSPPPSYLAPDPKQEVPAATPKGAPGQPARNRTSIKPAPSGKIVGKQKWKFPIAAGGHVWLYRTNFENGGKTVARTKLCDKTRRGPFLPYPGFNPDLEVLIVEGPKSCDAARAIGLNATCWFASPADVLFTDWSAIASRKVVLWPDNDPPGHHCMRRLSDHLAGNLSFAVRMVNSSRLAVSEDIADVDPDIALAMYRQARPRRGGPH